MKGDAALRTRLDALLTAHEQPDTLLPTPVEAARATIKLDLAWHGVDLRGGASEGLCPDCRTRGRWLN